MSRFAQVGWEISKRLYEAFLYLFVARYVALSFRLGLWGTLVAFVAIGVFSRFVLTRIRRRRPGSELSEIGRIEMEIAAWTVPGSPDHVVLRTVYSAFDPLLVAVCLIVLGHEELTFVEAHFWRTGGDSDLATLILLAGVAASMYTGYRNRWRRLLVTDQGLFQVVDTKRPWPSDRRLEEPHSPLRAVRIYSWDQIARFHWRQKGGKYVLQLSAHQPECSVPQLVSFSLRNLTEEDWQTLDHLLQARLSDTSPSKSLVAH